MARFNTHKLAVLGRGHNRFPDTVFRQRSGYSKSITVRRTPK